MGEVVPEERRGRLALTAGPGTRIRPIVEPAPQQTNLAPSSEQGAIVLPPGAYLVEIGFARPTTADVLIEALAAMGWQDDPILDASSEKPHVRSGLWTSDEDLKPSRSRHRFIGALAGPRQIAISNTPLVRWRAVLAVPFDPFAPMRNTIVPFELEDGVLYALRFTSRLRGHSSRLAVLEGLEEMGFQIDKLVEMRSRTRVPGRDASISVWYATGTWRKVSSLVTEADPFLFEDVARLEPPETLSSPIPTETEHPHVEERTPSL